MSTFTKDFSTRTSKRTTPCIGPVTASLKLTRKGRRFIHACIGVTIVALTALITAALWSQQPLAPAVAADDTGVEHYEQILVQPGDTLWGISTRLSENEEPGVVLEQIVQYNNLESSNLEIGQPLYVPVAE